MQKAVLKPSKKGLKVMDPQTMLHLKEEGKEVPLNNYWRRMISCGDCVKVEAKKEVVSEVVKPNKKVKTNNQEKLEE